MQRVEQFMRELFLARIAEEERVLATRAPYRQKYFKPGCQWDSHAGTLEMIQTESIVTVEGSDSEAKVTTEYKVPFYARGPQTHRLRYHLEAAGGSWLVCRVDLQCPACRGQGDESCISCKGKHWL